MEKNKNFLVGIYSDEDMLVEGVKKIRSVGIKIHEVYTPFPVHGLDEALGYKRSKLSVVAFLFGLTGTILALAMQYYMLGVDWPMIIGGKDHAPLPTFIPVTFEVTVLLAALGMVAVFLVISDLKPYKKPRIFDLRSTDNMHVVAVDLADNQKQTDEISSILKDAGAVEVNNKDFNEEE